MLSRLIYSFKIYKYTKDNLKKGDVLNIHGLEYGYFIGLFKKRLKGIKIFTSSHGSLYQEIDVYICRRLPNKYFYVKIFFYFFKWFYYHIEKISGNGADKIIFICKENMDYYKKTYGNKKSEIIHNGFNTKFYKKIKHSIGNKTFKAIIVGSSTYRKGLDIAVPAIIDLNNSGYDIQLMIVGFEGYNPPNHTAIVYCGRVKQSAVQEYMKKASFLLFPSRYESFGNVVIEAYLEGKPAVISTTCVKSDLPYQQCGIVVEGYNLEIWKNSIKKMMDDYQQKAENVAQLNLSDYNSKTVAKKYEISLMSI